MRVSKIAVFGDSLEDCFWYSSNSSLGHRFWVGFEQHIGNELRGTLASRLDGTLTGHIGQDIRKELYGKSN